MKENIQNFENMILNKENTEEIKYTVDSNMEALVKYEYLYDINNFNTVARILNETSI